MKTALIALFALALTPTLPAFGSDEFTSDVVCTKVTPPGEADNGLSVLVQSNPTAWVKRVLVVEHGYAGSRAIGSFQIPLEQPMVSTPSYLDSSRIAIYKTSGFELRMAVADAGAKKILGPGQALIKLPRYSPLRVNLVCKRVR